MIDPKMYPRSSGHCLSHHIPADIVTLQESPLPTQEELNAALVYLKEQRADLVKGDLILFDGNTGYRNDGVAIFDGVKIIDLAFEPDDYGTLPQVFHVIEGGVPIKYWEDRDDTDVGRGITHNNIVWFDHSLVRDECLRNIAHGFLGGKYAIYTTFVYNNVEYHIVFDYVDEMFDKIDHDTLEFYESEDKDKCLAVFRKALSDTTKLIPFDFYSEFPEEYDNDTTLFMSSYYCQEESI